MPSSRYDLIVDINHKLLRIQVKTCNLENIKDGYISFKACSNHINTKGTVVHTYSKNDVDCFATYYNNNCYIIPIEKIGVREFRLRIAPTKNGQIKNINFAENFLLEKFLSSND